ncbi:MAG: imelysin family protein [Bacteroidota bacterium]|nr:imelysin family protein [Bacteroidota bacterium]
MRLKILLKIILLAFFISCSGSDSAEETSSNSLVVVDNNTSSSTSSSTTSSETTSTTPAEFDRGAMLAFWADKIIIPSLESFNESLFQLLEATNSFIDNPDQEKISQLREKWLLAYKSWQFVEMFDIGKAEEIYFKNRLNLYPVNKDRVNSNIDSGSYDLDKAENFTSQGFPAVDYLLFGIAENDENIISKYLVSDSPYSKYLKEVVSKAVELTNIVKVDWEEGYRNVFVELTDNTATSSINKLTNDFIFYYEKGFRAHKIGIPAGVFSGSSLPDRVEAYYGRIYSRVLAIEAAIAVDNFFNGRSYSDNEDVGLSLKSYLDFIEGDGVSSRLSDEIDAQIEASIESIGSLNENFVDQVNENNIEMLRTYDVIQAGVVMLKVDMLQKLNISVDYVDADGD